MFSRKKPPPIKSLIAQGTRVQGDVLFADGLRVDGEVIGDLRSTAEPSIVVVSESAKVEGAVHAAHVIVNGTVEGPVYMPRSCWRFSPRRGSPVTCITRPLKCTRAR